MKKQLLLLLSLALLQTMPNILAGEEVCSIILYDENAVETLRTLVVAGASLTNRSQIGTTAFMCAANAGKMEVCKFLINQQEFEVDATNSLGETPLMKLVAHHDEKFTTEQRILLCKRLLTRGANKEFRNIFGFTPLMKASTVPMSDFLLKEGADQTARQSSSGTALMIAAISSHLEICRTMVTNACLFPKRAPQHTLRPIRKTIKTIFLLPYRLGIPTVLMRIIILSNEELKEQLFHLIFSYFLAGNEIKEHWLQELVVEKIYNHTIEHFPPLLEEAQKVTEGENSVKIIDMLDPNHLEDAHGHLIKENIRKRLPILAQRPSLEKTKEPSICTLL